MKETTIYQYYAFGYNYHMWKEGWKNKAVETGISHLEAYLEEISGLKLQVTSQVVLPLEGHLEELKELKKEDVIPKALATTIEEIIEGADKALDAELSLKTVLSVTPKRFDIPMLLESPQNLLPDGTWSVLSETAKKDFSDATRCIAMNLSTAAAFHLMRCVEESVRLLYFKYVRSGRMEKPMWGPMIEKLRNKNKPKPPSPLLDHLDMIRANFRNPTQHPDKFYGIDEAQDLLNSSIVALSTVCRDIGPSAGAKI